MIFKQSWQGVRLGAQGEEVFPASVPGNIQYDYAEANGFGDVMYGENVRRFEALEDDEWEYHARLEYEAADGERVFFVSRGIDYKYEIRLNGETIYAYEGMFRGVELDLTDRLCGGVREDRMEERRSLRSADLAVERQPGGSRGKRRSVHRDRRGDDFACDDRPRRGRIGREQTSRDRPLPPAAR